MLRVWVVLLVLSGFLFAKESTTSKDDSLKGSSTRLLGGGDSGTSRESVPRDTLLNKSSSKDKSSSTDKAKSTPTKTKPPVTASKSAVPAPVKPAGPARPLAAAKTVPKPAAKAAAPSKTQGGENILVLQDSDEVILTKTEAEEERALNGIILFTGQKAVSMLVDEKITVNGKTYDAHEVQIPREDIQEIKRGKNADLRRSYQIVHIAGLRYAVLVGEGGEARAGGAPAAPELPPFEAPPITTTAPAETPKAEHKPVPPPEEPKFFVPPKPPEATPAPSVPPAPVPAAQPVPQAPPRPAATVPERPKKTVSEVLKTVQEGGIDSVLEDIKNNPDFFKDVQIK